MTSTKVVVHTSACVAMGLMLAAPLVTAAILSRTGTAPAGAVAATRANAPSGSRTAADHTPSRSGGGADSATPPVLDARPNTLLGAVVAVWLAGVAILFVRFVVGWRSVRRLRRTAMRSASSRWSATAQRIASGLDLHWPIRVVDSFDVDTPTVVGWLKPLILLPVAGLANLTPAQIEAIVAHELAHVRRHDCLVNLLQVIAETLLFYHPAVWWVSARIRIEREHCCDDIAASVSGDVVAYAEALVELERWRVEYHALAIAATDGPLVARIRRLLRPSSIEAPRSAAIVSITGLAVVLICLWGAAQYLRASQIDPSSQTLTEPDDAAAWSMVFNHDDSQMRFIGFRRRDLVPRESSKFRSSEFRVPSSGVPSSGFRSSGFHVQGSTVRQGRRFRFQFRRSENQKPAPPNSNSELRTANCELGTANSELRTRNSELGTWNSKSYLYPAACSSNSWA